MKSDFSLYARTPPCRNTTMPEITQTVKIPPLRSIQTMQLCSVKHGSQTLPRRHLESNRRCSPSSRLAIRAIRQCLQHPETAWSSAPWRRCCCFMEQSCLVFNKTNEILHPKVCNADKATQIPPKHDITVSLVFF